MPQHFAVGGEVLHHIYEMVVDITHIEAGFGCDELVFGARQGGECFPEGPDRPTELHHLVAPCLDGAQYFLRVAFH